jgi:hypothetical protein
MGGQDRGHRAQGSTSCRVQSPGFVGGEANTKQSRAEGSQGME